MTEFYGIDLGTTYSCIAVIDSDDVVTVINNTTGSQTTPSVISFDDDGKLLVGRAAKFQLGNRPENTIAFIKREMSNKQFSRTIQGKSYDPVMVSSFILKELVDSANKKRLDEEGASPINDVVITVPAYFGDMERQRTIAAGEMAGLNVVQLINEPTAAALAYGRKQQANKTILVYDLGGGTFDVSILQIKNGIMETLGTNGDQHLGGADWDQAIVEYALTKIGTSLSDLSLQEQGMMLLAAEDCKQTLTGQNKATMSFSYKGIHNVDITKDEFEALTEALVERTMAVIDEVFTISGMSSSQIDEVLLVGGSSRMPMVKAAVSKRFGQGPKLVDPDLAVAKGAALMAAQNGKGYVRGGITMGKDKGSRAYGMGTTMDGGETFCICNLIMRNDDLEVHKEFNNFSTLNDGQSRVDFKFYENESTEEYIDVDPELELKGRNDYIDWGHPVPAHTGINIIVDRDKSGRITVFAECKGAKGEFVIVAPGCHNKK
ncbi:MAG: Hsp70 family protein [Acinetobacter sp.]